MPGDRKGLPYKFYLTFPYTVVTGLVPVITQNLSVKPNLSVGATIGRP